jgi:hypothetical protein
VITIIDIRTRQLKCEVSPRFTRGDAEAYYNEIDEFAAQWLRNLIGQA